MRTSLSLLLAAASAAWAAGIADVAARPDVGAAMRYIDQHKSDQLAEWIRITEIPAPSRHEQKRGDYIRGEMEKLGLAVAVDSMGNIHSGSAIPDPIGDTLQDETTSESLDYYQPDILDEDPVLGGPEGIANTRVDDDPIETFADVDENIMDRLDRPEDQQ